MESKQSCFKNTHHCFSCDIRNDLHTLSNPNRPFRIETKYFAVIAILSSFVVFVSQGEYVEAAGDLRGFALPKTIYFGLIIAFGIYLVKQRTVQQSLLVSNEILHLSTSSKDIAQDTHLTERLMSLLSRAIQHKTVSYDLNNTEGLKTNFSEFEKFHKFLKVNFPNVHNSPFVKLTVVNDYSLLYEWKGKNESLKPVMLCAHLDVVPADNVQDWKIDDPFSGYIDKTTNEVWGRGAIDNKHNVIAQLCAVDDLISNGVSQIERTVYLAYGHDEEVGGSYGAKHIEKELMLKLNQVSHENNKNSFGSSAQSSFRSYSPLLFILDEGPFLIENLFQGMKETVALVGVGEKGFLNLKLTVKAFPPGHSSMPSNNFQNNIGILAKAICKLESHPFPSNIQLLTDSMVAIEDSLPIYLKVLFKNAVLFRRLILYIMLKNPVLAASLRTTTAITLLRSGNKINVIPGEACAWLNHRIHPSVLTEIKKLRGGKDLVQNIVDKDIIDFIIDYNRKVVNDDRVLITYEGGEDQFLAPAPVSDTKNEAYSFLKSLVKDCFNAPSSPMLMTGNTDTRHYWNLSRNIYRFSPIVFRDLSETKMFHGNNERISGENLYKLYRFYETLLKNLSVIRQ